MVGLRCVSKQKLLNVKEKFIYMHVALTAVMAKRSPCTVASIRPKLLSM